MKTIYNLQVCRALAAIMVLLEHASLIIQPDMLNGFLSIGWCGVDFFFVLSGFIIYAANYKYIGDSAQFGQYISKRLFRIYPIYWIYTVIVLFVFIFFLNSGYTGAKIIKSLFLYPFHTERGEFPVIQPAHTLTFELFFYIIFSVGVLTSRKGFKIVLAVWLAAIIGNALLGGYLSKYNLLRVVLDPINVEFFYGILLAYAVVKKKFAITKPQAWALLAGGLILLLVSWLTQLYNVGPFLKAQYIKFGLPFSLIIYAVCYLDVRDSKSALKSIFVKLGDASYSIYLIHYTGILLLTWVIFPRVFPMGAIPQLLACLVILVGVSYLSYLFIEKPMNKYFGKIIHHNLQPGMMNRRSVVFISSILLNVVAGFAIIAFVFKDGGIMQGIKNKVLPEKQFVAVAVFGDSRVAQADFGAGLNRKDVKNGAIGGLTTYRALKILDSAVIQFHPKECFIQIGINDLREARRLDSTKNNVLQILNRLEANKINPVVTSVIYLRKDFWQDDVTESVVNNKADSLNKWLYATCKDRKFGFIDINSYLIDSTNRLNREYTSDGIHLNDAGYKVYFREVSSYLKAH